MVTLFGLPGAASLAPHILLAEAQIEHRFVIPNRDGPEAGPPEFLAAGPGRKVPVLVDGELTLTEAAAICLHIADGVPGALAPPPGDPTRAHFYRWLAFLCATVQPLLYQFIYPERFGSQSDREPTRTAADRNLVELWGWIDGELTEREYLLSSGFSAADAYLWMLMRWSRHQPTPAFERPNLRGLWERVAARSAVVHVHACEDLEPLGI